MLLRDCRMGELQLGRWSLMRVWQERAYMPLAIHQTWRSCTSFTPSIFFMSPTRSERAMSLGVDSRRILVVELRMPQDPNRIKTAGPVLDVGNDERLAGR